MTKWLYLIGGWILTLGVSFWLIYDKFVRLNVNYWLKIAFGGLLVILVVFLILWAKINQKIGRRLQAVESAKEQSIVGRTKLYWVVILDFIGIVVPMLSVSGLFILVSKYFQEMGMTLLYITFTFVFAGIGEYMFKQQERNEIIVEQQTKEEAFIDKVAEKVRDYQ